VLTDALRYCSAFVVSDRQAPLLGVLDPEGKELAVLQMSANA